MLIFHQHILLIACEPLLNLMTNYLICVAGKQWETLRFTIEVSTCMVRCLIAHYCAIAGTIIIFMFLTIWSYTCRSCCQRFSPTVRPFLHMGNELSMNISQVNKIFICTMKKTLVHYRMVLTIIPCLFYSFAPFPI